MPRRFVFHSSDFSRLWPGLLAGLILAAGPLPLVAQSNLEKAMRFRPSQPGVQIDTPDESALEKCTIRPTDTRTSKPGWIVQDDRGRTIRRFLDHNKDGNIDQLSYFRNGIEVYRDVDTNFDKKFDEMRWLGMAGTRWGTDSNQDGQIDRWKMISPEEVSVEVVQAIKDNDPARFAALLVSERELDRMGLGSARKQQVAQRVDAARKGFAGFVRSQDLIDADTEWVHFGGMRPSVIPSGTDGSTADTLFYDSVAAVVDNGGDAHGQLSIGTLVRVDQAWRVVDLPEPIVEGQTIANGGIFYQGIEGSGSNFAASGGSSASGAEQELYEEYEELENSIRTATTDKLPDLNARRAELFMRMIELSKSDENRSNWVRQMADTVSGAWRNDEFPEGGKVLARNISALKKQGVDDNDIAYAEYRRISNLHSREIDQAAPEDLDKLQDEHMQTLREFVTSWPEAEPAAEAMLQIGLQDEFEGNIEEALDWYRKISRDFPETASARKASGASIRLESEGRVIPFAGTTLEGREYDLASRRGKVVLLQYWATWCEPCKEDLVVIRKAHEKYSRSGFEVVSISLDNSPDELRKYLKQESLPWTHLYEEGGLDSPLADRLGVSMVPTMILVGDDGKVINRNLSARDLDKSLDRAFRKDAAKQGKKK